MCPATIRQIIAGYAAYLMAVLGLVNPPSLAVTVALVSLLAVPIGLFVWQLNDGKKPTGWFHSGGAASGSGLKPNEQATILDMGPIFNDEERSYFLLNADPFESWDHSWLPAGWNLNWWIWAVDGSQWVQATRIVDLGEGRSSVIRVIEQSHSPILAYQQVQARVHAVVSSTMYEGLPLIEEGIRKGAPLFDPPRQALPTDLRQEWIAFTTKAARR